MSSLATILADVRVDLHDEAGTKLWEDATLTRHIERALQEYSHVSPIEQKTALPTDANARTVDVSSLTPRIRIVATEHPTGEYPPLYVPFTIWGDVLTLDISTAPAGTPNINIFWHKEHNIEGEGSFPSNHDQLIATGAAGFAAIEWATFATNRVNTAGNNVWGMYADMGHERLKSFREQLQDLPAASRVRTARLYSPTDRRLKSQTTDPGPE